MILRTRLSLLALSLALSWPTSAAAQPPRAPAPINPRLLAVDPAPTPVPALKYRLLPSAADLNPGDAAPIYLRTRYQTADGPWKAIGENYLKWRNLPLDQFPAAEARKFVDQYSKPLEQIEFGARRRTCDWNYALPEQRIDQVNLDLSDAGAMRPWLQLLDLKARVEIAEGKTDRALRTIETGLAFSRHIAEGPFLINALIGMMGTRLLLTDLEELIARPGAPNLYWALTALPRPLIDFRREIENEQKLFENIIPELTEAGSDRPRTAAEWSSLLSRMHARIVHWLGPYKDDATLKALATSDLAGFKAACLPVARAYLATSRGPGDPPPAGMSDDQVIALYLAAGYREVWDDHFKAAYLPVRDAIRELNASEKRLNAARSGPLVLFVSMTPAIGAVMRTNLRDDRQVAALRVIEALRLYAASHDGQLPESLDQITQVPVPDDPATGEPFIYRAADSAAILHGLRADLPYPPPTYRITVRR